MTLKECLAVALIGLYFFAIPPVNATPLDARSTAILYNMAQALSKYKLPDIAPVVDYVPQEKLAALVCQHVCPQIYGAQVGNKVYIADSLDMEDPMNRSVMFHEFIHFLQWANKGEAKDCQEYLEREREAYGWQKYILEKIGLRLRIPVLPLCS